MSISWVVCFRSPRQYSVNEELYDLDEHHLRDYSKWNQFMSEMWLSIFLVIVMSYRLYPKWQPVVILTNQVCSCECGDPYWGEIRNEEVGIDFTLFMNWKLLCCNLEQGIKKKFPAVTWKWLSFIFNKLDKKWEWSGFYSSAEGEWTPQSKICTY